MKDKENQIEKMANDICSKTPQECVSMGGRCNCLINERALEKLYNAGYQNCKDKVVLSKEEYEKLKSLPNKIIKYMDRHLGDGELSGNVLRKCAKQFGIEIKE